MIKNIWSSYRNQPTKHKVFLALFALLFTKSIFISPFSLVDGLLGVIIGVLLCIVVFLLCIVALFFLSKITWKYKPTKVKKTKILLYMIPSLVLSTILLLAVFPGIMSWDSMYIWESVITNNYSSLHPIAYVMFVKLLYTIVSSPWLVIAVQFTYSAFIFAYIGYMFEGFGLNKKICWLVVVALSIYPVNAITNVTMLKDVPYIMSLVLLSALLLKVLVENKLGTGSAVSIATVSAVAMFSRHNGLLSVPLTLAVIIVYFIARKNKPFIIKSAIILVSVLVFFFGMNKIITTTLGNWYWERSSASDILMTPSAQLSYTIDKNWTALTESQEEKARLYFNIGYINFQKDYIPNWHFNNRYLETMNLETILIDKNGFIDFYLDMIKSYPLDMIKEYEQLTGIVWATPNYGYTLLKNDGIPEGYVDIGLQTDYKIPKLAEFLSQDPKVLFWLRPALWLMLSFLFLFISNKRHGKKGLIIITPMLANAVVYLLGTPAQNVRYFYCNFSCFIILLLISFMVINTEDKKTSPNESELEV